MNYDELLDFFNKLDRSVFLGDEFKPFADENNPLPIGYGQTISQPSLVVEMTNLLDLEKDSKVLEIGTGSGYQTAFLAEFSDQVYTVESIHEFSESAQERLKKMGYTNIFFKTGDGSEGWKENAPYDRIIVTAAAGRIPQELIDQLDIGGIMLIPVGLQGKQELTLIAKNTDGEISSETIDYVRFVELKGKYGWQRHAKQ